MVKNPEQVAPRAVEVAVDPVPAAPTITANVLPVAAEPNQPERSLRAESEFPLTCTHMELLQEPCEQIAV